MGRSWERQTAIINGKTPTEKNLPDEDKRIFIINYDILMGKAVYKKIDGKKKKVGHEFGWKDYFIDCGIGLVVMDEVHKIANKKAGRSKATIELAKNAKAVIALSGTPINNRPKEFFNILNLLDPARFSSEWHYKQTFCGAKHNGFGWDFNGSSNTKKLYKLVKNIMIRHLKKDVLTELPDKQRSIIPVQLSNRAEYRRASIDIIEWIEDKQGAEAAEKAMDAKALVEFEKLKQLAVDGKKKAVIDWINNFLESDEKLIIFAIHKKVVDWLYDEYKNIAVKLTGSTTNQNRQNAVDNFQNNPEIKLFVGNIEAAGVGITLTAASNVAIIELPWRPGDLDQAEDRAHRIGQKNTVNIWYLLAENTIENEIAELLDEKREVLDAVLDGHQAEKTSLLTELIKKN